MAKKNKKKWKQNPKGKNQADEGVQENSYKENHRDNHRENHKFTQQSKPLPVIELAKYNCSFCSQAIQDLPSALSDKQTGEPVHFDCVLEHLKKTEDIGLNEKLFYIGKGNFAIAYFENPHDLRKFEIKKLIEWENKEKVIEWRDTICDLYSQVE